MAEFLDGLISHYVLDGGKALHAAVNKYAGEMAPVQRCQVHKRRNVLDHLREEDKLLVARKLNAAYALPDYDAAKKALDGLHRELMDLNPSAARSLGEGLEDADRAQTSCSRATAENAGQYQPD